MNEDRDFAIEERISMMTEDGTPLTDYHALLLAEQIMAEFGLGAEASRAIARDAIRPRSRSARA